MRTAVEHFLGMLAAGDISETTREDYSLLEDIGTTGCPVEAMGCLLGVPAAPRRMCSMESYEIWVDAIERAPDRANRSRSP